MLQITEAAVKNYKLTFETRLTINIYFIIIKLSISEFTLFKFIHFMNEIKFNILKLVHSYAVFPDVCYHITNSGIRSIIFSSRAQC